jgi:ABC-2 type transport system ATP-binding protein
MGSISFHHLTKHFGRVKAVDDLSFDVEAGRVTAFLGANGSGKTTSMRTLLALTDPTAGTATIGGVPYAAIRHPTRMVGAVLDQGMHPNRTARNHLLVVAAQAGVPDSRVDDTLDLVGLTQAARRRVGGYSLGMRQRLALASALVPDPSVLVLDEPFNGLDPDGINAMRAFLRHFADQGGTVFLSSHLLAEVEHSADDAVIIDHGHLVTAGPVSGLGRGDREIMVTATDADRLTQALQRRSGVVRRTATDQLGVSGVSREVIGRAALDSGVAILEMRARSDGLESVFQQLIHGQEVAS